MERQTFESFFVLPSNRDAHSAVRAWAEAGFPQTILLLGPPGVGKTHLARAALRELAARGERVRRTSVESYLHGYVAALLAGEREFARYRGPWREEVPALVLEHLEDLGEKRASADEVMHLLFARENARLRTLLTASLTPSQASTQPWMERLVTYRPLVVVIDSPRRRELESLAARLHTWPDRGSWEPCSNPAEVLGEIRRRAFTAAHS